MKDPLGDRMKIYEGIDAHTLIPRLPICVRIDGRAFHTFTKKLKKPYDDDLCQLMVRTTKQLVKETKANIGYTQSDEISLILHNPEPQSQAFFGGKIQKLCSVLASIATAHFVYHIPTYLEKFKLPTLTPTFDCRVWNVPSEIEAANVILWRWFDARRNSISTLAQTHFSNRQLHKKTTAEMLVLLKQKDIIWDNYPDRHKWGTFVKSETIIKELSEEELANIPEKHRPENKKAIRTHIININMPPLLDISNRVEVLLYGAEPKIDKEA